jgi:hypothetical protein
MSINFLTLSAVAMGESPCWFAFPSRSGESVRGTVIVSFGS